MDLIFGSKVVLNNSPAAAPPTDSKNDNDDAASLRIASSLNKAIMALYGAFLSEDGASVDYKAMKTDQRFQDFVNITPSLHQASQERKKMTQDNKLD